MPATLDQAFRSPFHHTSNSDTASIRNPDYFSFQNNFRVKSAKDIASEAHDISSVYNSIPTPEPDHRSLSDDHQCNFLISKVLSCSHCRNKLRKILLDDKDERDTVVDDPAPKQAGGGAFGGLAQYQPLVSNIILSILLIIVIDLLWRAH